MEIVPILSLQNVLMASLNGCSFHVLQLVQDFEHFRYPRVEQAHPLEIYKASTACGVFMTDSFRTTR